MSASSVRLPARAPRLPIGYVLFFVLFYLYVWLVVDPVLIYHAYWITTTFPVFWTNWAFLKEFLAHPGGPVEYVSAFLCQLYYYPWAGALGITGVAALLSLTTWVVLKRVGGARPRLLHFVPAALLVVLYSRYGNPLPGALALLAAMACVCLYVTAPVRKPVHRLALFVVLSGVLYYAAGGVYLLYALLCGTFELLTGRRVVLGVICLLIGAAIPYVAGTFVFRLRITDSYWRLLPFHEDGDPRARLLVPCLYLFFPVAALGVGLWQALRSRRAAASEGGPSSGAARLLARFRGSKLRRTLESVAPIVITGGLLYVSFDARLRSVFCVEYYGRKKMWPQLLDAADYLPAHRYDFRDTLFVNWDVNRALHHTRRLPDDMFSYGQHTLGLLPSPQALGALSMPYPGWMKLSDMFIELGAVNESEHMAYEALEFLGDRPHILQRLVLIRAAKAEAEATRILLGALSNDMVCGGWARRHLRSLETEPTLSSHPEVQRLRPLMVDTDVVGWLTPEQLLLNLLDKNKQNRMAFEYLMAHYLLNCELDKIVQNIGRLDDFDYARIPRHYEEAILLYRTMTGRRPNLHGRRISADTLSRYREFSATHDRYKADRQTAWNALYRDHGNSYFFYYVFGRSGVAE